MVTHMAYWAGGDQHVQIQTNDCLAKPLIRNPDWQWGLFEVESVDQDSDIVLGLPEPGWISWIISGLYSIVTLVLIARGLIAFLLQNRIAQYIPDEVRYSKEHRLARYVAPFMPITTLLTEDDRLTIPFKGSLLIASDVWMNNWLYITLSILDSVSNIRMTYAALHLGTIYIVTRITPQNFLFVCQALTGMTWITCLIHTVLRVVAKVSIRSLRSIQLIQRTTRDKLVRFVDDVAMFISFKIYNIFLCIILFGMMKTMNSTSFQIRQNPHKVGNYGGIPRIATFWRSELMCDLITILLMLTACGHVLGKLLMLTRFRKIADNGVMQLLQKRYFWVGWDALMAAKMLGLDPTRSTWMVDGKAVTRCPLGTLIQTLYQSGPSGFVHLAGDYIFTGSGFTAEPRKFHFPAKRAIDIGLCSGSKGSLYRKDGATEPESAFTLQRNTTHPTAMVAPVDRTGATESFLQKEKTSIFDRDLKLVADGYMGKILLVDKAEPGAMTTNKDTGLREYVVCDALSTISILDIKSILGNEKKLRIK